MLTPCETLRKCTQVLKRCDHEDTCMKNKESYDAEQCEYIIHQSDENIEQEDPSSFPMIDAKVDWLQRDTDDV